QPVEAIALDFEFPAGLFQANETTGDAEEAEVEIRIQYQPIDDDGETTGDAVNVDLTIATTDHLPTGTPITTPVRFTHEITPAEGQYRLRIRRTSATPDDARGQSRMDWVGLKGRRPVQVSPVYGKTTLAAVRIRASEGLSGEAISTIRAEVARRLPPIGATRNETALGQTRNPATAIFDMATDPDYGMGLDPAETFDLAELAAAKALWNSAGLTFDHHFTEFTTLWEAMGLAAQAALAEPLAYAGTVTIAQDGPKASPVQMFSPQNITAGENGGSSLEIDYAFDRSRDVDGVRIVYRDQASAKERSVTWPAGAATPTEEAIAGITSDAIALDMA
ncbi:MAG: host specificity factor TipJ family phage tail protein, partial [Pseudomonadota bacterium]|nr:host specificity factor TipJ family phage tail protein [Pseudomonadota bacterium]